MNTLILAIVTRFTKPLHDRTLADAWEAGRAEQYAADLLGRDANPNPWRRRG